PAVSSPLSLHDALPIFNLGGFPTKIQYLFRFLLSFQILFSLLHTPRQSFFPSPIIHSLFFSLLSFLLKNKTFFYNGLTFVDMVGDRKSTRLNSSHVKIS